MKKFKKLLAAMFAFALVFTALPVQAAQDASALPDGTAYLNINNADWSDFEAEWTNAEITGDGTYTVGMVAKEGQSLVQFNALEVVNGESVLGTGCVLTVDSIKINGEEVELQGPSFTCSADGGGVTTRVNIYNEWNAPDDTATAGEDSHLDQRVAEGSVMDATACLFSSDYVDASSGSGFKVESLEVTFTVSGYGTQAGDSENAGETETAEGEAPEAEAVDLNGTYNAYLGLQTPVYSFRNAFDDATYGRDTEYFNQMTGWDGNDPVKKDGTFTDAVIAGNGTYTVSASGLGLDGDFDSQDYFNLIFISTDIPNTGEITISDITLNIDGRDVQVNPILSPDSVNYVNMLIQNIWNDEVATIGYYSVPPKEVTVTFTVSGFAYDNEASAEPVAEPSEEPSEESEAAPAEAPAEETSSSSVSTVVIVVIVVVVIAVVVAAVVIAGKKKKS